MLKTQHSEMHEGKFARILYGEERDTPCGYHHPYTVGPREEANLYAQEVAKPYINIRYKLKHHTKKQVEEFIRWSLVQPLLYVRKCYTSYMEMPPRPYGIDPTKQHVVPIFGSYTVQSSQCHPFIRL